MCNYAYGGLDNSGNIFIGQDITLAKRKFHDITVEITKNPTFYNITITNGWWSNNGLIYNYKIPEWLKNPNIQIIGMETNCGLNKSIREWIYLKIRKLYQNGDITVV